MWFFAGFFKHLLLLLCGKIFFFLFVSRFSYFSHTTLVNLVCSSMRVSSINNTSTESSCLTVLVHDIKQQNEDAFLQEIRVAKVENCLIKFAFKVKTTLNNGKFSSCDLICIWSRDGAKHRKEGLECVTDAWAIKICLIYENFNHSNVCKEKKVSLFDQLETSFTFRGFFLTRWDKCVVPFITCITRVPKHMRTGSTVCSTH